jgi:hypothetical protein
MLNQKDRKFVQITCSSHWYAAMGAIFERYCDPNPWGLHARIVDKQTAQAFLGKGVILFEGNDQSIAENLRHRHKEAYFVPTELPEKCGPRDSILLVRKRESGDDVKPGHDNRYLFFLVTWLDPLEANLEFEQQEPVGAIEKRAGRGAQMKCLHGVKPRASGRSERLKRSNGSDASDREKSNRKRGFQKGLTGSGQRHRWHF